MITKGYCKNKMSPDLPKGKSIIVSVIEPLTDQGISGDDNLFEDIETMNGTMSRYDYEARIDK